MAIVELLPRYAIYGPVAGEDPGGSLRDDRPCGAGYIGACNGSLAALKDSPSANGDSGGGEGMTVEV